MLNGCVRRSAGASGTGNTGSTTCSSGLRGNRTLELSGRRHEGDLRKRVYPTGTLVVTQGPTSALHPERTFDRGPLSTQCGLC
jgi:hypothetical protein